MSTPTPSGDYSGSQHLFTLDELVARWRAKGASRDEVVGWTRRACKDWPGWGDENVDPDLAGQIYDKLEAEDEESAARP